MAGLIVKSPYIKCGKNHSAAGYLCYIGTRERVEILPDARPPTKSQQQMIKKLLTDFPELKSSAAYETYQTAPTKYYASQFISEALDENASRIQTTEGHMKYIAQRPRAERFGSHGLFGDADYVDLDAAMAELQGYTGNVWTHIFSLRREDAERLGYDNAAAWRDLLRAHRNEIAAATRINPNDFRWYAAFHNEGHHPHVHMMAWSREPGKAYLTEDGIREIKSKLTNDIFRMELLELYKEKSQVRDDVVQQARKSLSKLLQTMATGIVNHPEVDSLFLKLAAALPQTGKKSYGYLPKAQKKLVDEIVDQMERLPLVRESYDRWLELQSEVIKKYKDEPNERVPLSRQKEFRAIKNAVIQEAEKLRQHQITFEETDAPDEEPEFLPPMEEETWDCIWDESLPLAERDQAVERLTRMAKAGNPLAKYLMGLLYRDGGIVIPDTELARDYFVRAAECGFAKARYAAGMLILSDDPAVQDREQGMRWLEQAAERGHSFAAYRLGKEHLQAGDRKTAERYFRSSDTPDAQYALGKLYLSDGDAERAGEFFSQAAEHGHPYAGLFLSRMEESTATSAMLAATSLLHHMAQIFRQQSLPKTGPRRRIDRKQWRAMQEKRAAQGIKGSMEDYGPDMNM